MKFTLYANRLSAFGAAAILCVSLLLALLASLPADAATLSRVIVRFDRMKISTATTGMVCVNPATASTEADVQVTFPTGYTVSTTTGNWTVSTTNLAWPSGAAAWPGIGTATAAAGQTVTFPSNDLTAGTLYCFNWTNTAALSVKSSATSTNSGSVTTRDGTTATIDTGNYATASLTDEQIVVTATVPQTFSFALSGNTDPLGTLSTGSVNASPTPRVVTVGTNAKNGWYAWAKDANTGLNSASAVYTVASTTPGTNSTLSAGSEGYNMGVTTSNGTGTGTVSATTPFVGGSTGRGGGLDTALRTIATSNGTNDGATLTLTNNVTISSITPAATDYTDTITVVGAGLF